MIPDNLIAYIDSLPDSYAKDLWDWLEGDPTAVQQMIECIARTHPRMARRRQRDMEKGK